MLKNNTQLIKEKIDEDKYIKDSYHQPVNPYRDAQIKEAGSYENYIKRIYGLKHGKGKRKKKR